jgi:hypothetical protein
MDDDDPQAETPEPARRAGRHAAPGRLASHRPFAIHPLFFAAFPVVFLWAHNLDEGIAFEDVIRPLLLVMGSALLLWLIGTLILRSARKAALAVSIVVALFFSYGALYQVMTQVHPGGIRLASGRILLPLWVALAVVGVVLAVRAGKWLVGLTRGLNVVSVGLIAINVISIVAFQARPNPSGSGFLEPGDVSLPKRILTVPPSHRPDVYYIILDEYGGFDTLRDLYGYDNSPFLDFLRSKGFYVADKSVTNYPRTELSVASSLNMKYVNYLSKQMPADSGDTTPLVKLLQNNQIGRVMQSLGYRYIHIGSWWKPTATSPIANVNLTYGGLSEFDQLLYDTTALNPIAGEDFRHTEWKRVQFQFSALTHLSKFKGPRFVFDHILCPHDPIVFDQAGHYMSEDAVEAESPVKAYIDQLIYTNNQVEKVVNELLSRPVDQQPVIILQADEGPPVGGPTFWSQHPPAMWLERKFNLLNAYYFPGVAQTHLYPTITPVNSFRLVLNDYFNAGLPLLPDRAYTFKNLTHLYDFTDITKLVQPIPVLPTPDPSPPPNGGH